MTLPVFVRLMLLAAAGAAVAALPSGCTPSHGAVAPAPALFEDRGPSSGVDFVTRHHKVGLTILETLGHGAGLCDFDGDGNLDLILVGPDHVALYRGDGKFHFQDVTAASGLAQTGYWEGVATGDFDGDGKPDLYLCGHGCSALYRNLGGMRFQNVTREAGVDVVPPPPGGTPEWRTSAAFVDVDRDGKLDLLVARYAKFGPHTPQLCSSGDVRIACDPQNYDSQRPVFYHNLGGGRFRDETRERGFGVASGHALGIAIADYDDDGWIDIAIANDEKPGDLFHNRKNGTFEQRGPMSGTAFDSFGHVHAGMGIDWGDYDRDGRQDLFVTTFQSEEKNLYRNLGKELFADMGLRTGLSSPIQPWISWGTKFFDYDNDGWLDLMVASGHVEDQVKRVNPQTDYPQPLVLFHNQRGDTYVDVSRQAGPSFQTPIVGRALATGDIDNDGGIDVVVTNAEGPPLLLRNVAPARGHWLSIRLEDTKGNTQGIGARITVQTPHGKMVHDVSTTGSFLSASDVRAHFGLGSDTAVEGITVRWPDGKSERFRADGIDRTLTLKRGTGTPASPASA